MGEPVSRARRGPAAGGMAAVAILACMSAGAALAACGGPSTPLAAHQILSSDTTSHTVQVTADAAYGGLGGDMNFDGYSNGHLTITVPYGWIVQVDCTNDSKLLSHSCAVVSDDRSQVLGTRPPAFPNAASPDPYDGSRPGAKSTFEFLADRVGRYRLTCLVHGHEVDGMWDYFVVAPAGTPPSVTTTT